MGSKNKYFLNYINSAFSVVPKKGRRIGHPNIDCCYVIMYSILCIWAPVST